MKKQVHLLCNAHLDPYWLWEWEEGAAEAIATFRIAAQCCEDYDGFIFCHNEVLLYKWVQEYDPALFERIVQLVQQGKWQIIGGWYLQPDCNMPSGESFVRQALLGREYFLKYFNVKPTTAINFDSFGHNRGLVQILRQSGYDSYIMMRPHHIDLPDNFMWEGIDGSEIPTHRIWNGYNTLPGKAPEKLMEWIKVKGHKTGLVLWGVGNHGGGPTRQDLDRLSALLAQDDVKGYTVTHSTPEAFFASLTHHREELPRIKTDLNPWAVGCYTSQVRIKQKHRQLENELYMLEKMMSNASLQGLISYEAELIEQALCDLMVSQFHDILPGSSIQPVEEAGLRLLDHGLEIASRLKARSFFALAAGQPAAVNGEIPIFAYNPHPYPIEGVFECEFQPADQNWEKTFRYPRMYQNGMPIPTQSEQTQCSFQLDWRKKVAFHARLEPASMTRFDCRFEWLKQKPEPKQPEKKNKIIFQNDVMTVVINTATGLMDRYCVQGQEMLKNKSFSLNVYEDNDDPWDMNNSCYKKKIGVFELMTPDEGTRFSGVDTRQLPSVRIVEDGDARMVVEALFQYHHSFAVVRYILPKKSSAVEVLVRLFFIENRKMVKLALRTALTDADYIGEVAYGSDIQPQNREIVAQKWVALVDDQRSLAVTLANEGTYGSDASRGEIRMSLVRGAGYSAHPILKRKPIMPDDRYSPRLDQGERLYRFVLDAGNSGERMAQVSRQAQVLNEKPFLLSFFPSGEGQKPLPGIMLSDDIIVMGAFKQAQDGKGVVVRLYNPTPQKRCTTLQIPAMEIRQDVEIRPFGILTLRGGKGDAALREVDLMEQ